jgi:hypothetical protein
LKLIIQIPSVNEGEKLPQPPHDHPQSIPKINEIKILGVDEGNTERSVMTTPELNISLRAFGMGRRIPVAQRFRPAR